ncbi:hypothetical protein Pth03_77050 [Planotetraspora thailandica]|uniref:Uncharacterized protein n=1 Tax=Planotetraspora thailandica TaxID=487172 RepID=A0A8J3Y214_9ACTN|nr:hypothetical protein [Planotetraspora thailandica]GII59316.1 hypothetical protein Pth03_77050 [Planotetraspora thailandica]
MSPRSGGLETSVLSEIVRRHDFPFPGGTFPVGLGAVVNRRVASGQSPALVVVHDDENDWLVGDGETDGDDSNLMVLHISHLVARDPCVGETATLPAGFVAWRSSMSDPWIIEPWMYPDDE